MNFKEYNWLIKEGFKEKESLFLSQGIDPQQVTEYINLFKELKLRNKIPKDKIDIDGYKTFDELKSVVDEYKGVKSGKELKAEAKINGAEKVFENDQWKVYWIKTVEASKLLGKGTKWCISAENDNAFDRYNKKNNIYILINNNEKYAVIVNVNGEIITYNSADKVISNFTELKSILKPKAFDIKNFIEGTYTIDEQGRYNVNGGVKLNGLNLTKLPVKFGKVTGGFSCSYNQLTSLEGAPSSVGGGFYCHYNQLTSLKGGPSSVGGNFYCYKNQLTSLKGGPSSVGGGFSCSYNQLTSLEGAPSSVGGSFDCSVNQLTSLEGAPNSVGGSFDCSGTPIKDWSALEKIEIKGNVYK